MRRIQVGGLCLLLLLPLQAIRSQVGALRILERPKKYQQPYNESDLAAAIDRSERMPNLAWLVWSDRDRNVSYTTAGGTQRQQTLSFLEEFYVVGEQGEYLRLAKDNQADAINLRLSPQAQDYGWIHKNKMILWGKTLVTEVGKIPRKAMLLNTIAHLQTQRGGEPNVVKFRKGPGEAYGSDQESGLFQFFFVVKSEKEGNETWLLLAKTENIPLDERNRKNLVAGWAPLSRVARWDDRITVEPNWEPEAVAERKMGRTAIAFADVHSAQLYANSGAFNRNAVVWREGVPNEKDFGKRRAGTWIRFPVLEPRSGIRTVGLIKDKMIVRAYIPMNTRGQRYPLYKDVLFLSREELMTMVNQMVELAHATEEREPLQKTWIEILKNYLGKIDMNAIREKTLQQLNEMAFGLPGTSDFLKDVKLVDITDPSRFPDRDLRRYVEGIRKKLVELQTIAHAPEEKVHFMFCSNETPYYWIAEDLIP